MSKKKKQPKDLRSLGTYTYEIQDDGYELKAGELITIRRMSEDERELFPRKRFRLLYHRALYVQAQMWTMCSPDEIDKLYDQALKLAKYLVADKEDRKRVLALNDGGNLGDLVGFVARICLVELALDSSGEIPEQVKVTDPADVDVMEEDEVSQGLSEAAELGEDCAPCEPPTTTPPTGSPAETCSSTPEDVSSASG